MKLLAEFLNPPSHTFTVTITSPLKTGPKPSHGVGVGRGRERGGPALPKGRPALNMINGLARLSRVTRCVSNRKDFIYMFQRKPGSHRRSDFWTFEATPVVFFLFTFLQSEASQRPYYHRYRKKQAAEKQHHAATSVKLYMQTIYNLNTARVSPPESESSHLENCH